MYNGPPDPAVCHVRWQSAPPPQELTGTRPNPPELEGTSSRRTRGHAKGPSPPDRLAVGEWVGEEAPGLEREMMLGRNDRSPTLDTDCGMPSTRARDRRTE